MSMAVMENTHILSAKLPLNRSETVWRPEEARYGDASGVHDKCAGKHCLSAAKDSDTLRAFPISNGLSFPGIAIPRSALVWDRGDLQRQRLQKCWLHPAVFLCRGWMGGERNGG